MTILHPDSGPLRVDDKGTIRVGNTRITLDVVLGYLLKGITSEQIVSEAYYPMLSLADVHGVLAYYHRHKADVDEYLRNRREAADWRQKEIEATQPTFAEMRVQLSAGNQPRR